MGELKEQNQLSIYQKYFICNQCFFWILQLVFLALILTVLSNIAIIRNIESNLFSSDNYGHALQTVSLWKKGYIIDIKAENTNNCPQGYQPLVNYTWSGTIDGCYCHTASNGFTADFVMQGLCPSNLISLGCTNINAMNPYTLNMWKGSILLCFKRAESMNFYNSIMTNAPSGGISSTMSTCAFNKTYQVNTLPGVQCPITSISNSSLGASQTKLTLDSVNQAYLNYISQTGYPIADIKITQYQFCSYLNQTNISPNKQGLYALLQNLLATTCTQNDSRVITVDSINQRDFYLDNSRVYQMISSLPAYPIPSVDYQYLMGYIPYPTWTYSCRNTSQFSLYMATDKLLFKNPSYSTYITSSIAIPFTIIVAIFFRIFYILRHIIEIKSKSTYKALMLTDQQILQQIPNLDIQKSIKKQTIIFLLQLISIIAIISPIIYSITVLTTQSVWIKQIVRYKCTDAYLQNILLNYQFSIDKMSYKYLQCSFIISVVILLHIIYFIFRNCFADLYKTVQIKQQSSVSAEQPQIVHDKQLDAQPYNPVAQSSQIIKQQSQIKINDIDDFMGQQNGQTKQNFYNPLQRQASGSILKKKKKKRTVKKKKNLFKQQQS